MARYKPYDANQVTLIPVSFPDQILPGSFEYALNEIVDQHIDMRVFEKRYKNDETGCLAYIQRFCSRSFGSCRSTSRIPTAYYSSTPRRLAHRPTPG